jgi:hypothetical protein
MVITPAKIGVNSCFLPGYSYTHQNRSSVRAFKPQDVLASKTWPWLPIENSVLQTGAGRQRLCLTQGQHVSPGCAEMQLDAARFFHDDRVAAIRVGRERLKALFDVQSMPDSHAIACGRLGQVRFGRRFSAGRIQYIEVAAAESFAMSLVVERVPGNCVNPVGERGSVQVEKAHRSAAVRVTGEQSRDIGTELVVNGMPDYLTVDYHCERGAINWHHSGLRSQCPAEVNIVRSGNVTALSRRIDAAEGFRGQGVIDGDRFGSEVDLVADLIMGDSVDLVGAVPGSAGAASIRQEVR